MKFYYHIYMCFFLRCSGPQVYSIARESNKGN